MVQVGDDSKANDYLDTLDTKLGPLGAKYDIVDCIPYKNLQGAGGLVDQIRAALASGADTSLLIELEGRQPLPLPLDEGEGEGEGEKAHAGGEGEGD